MNCNASLASVHTREEVKLGACEVRSSSCMVTGESIELFSRPIVFIRSKTEAKNLWNQPEVNQFQYLLVFA